MFLCSVCLVWNGVIMFLHHLFLWVHITVFIFRFQHQNMFCYLLICFIWLPWVLFFYLSFLLLSFFLNSACRWARGGWCKFWLCLRVDLCAKLHAVSVSFSWCSALFVWHQNNSQSLYKSGKPEQSWNLQREIFRLGKVRIFILRSLNFVSGNWSVISTSENSLKSVHDLTYHILISQRGMLILE